MKLIDLLEIINENENVNIVNDGMIISTYDGKNSIDKVYNACSVKEVYLSDNSLNVVINF